MEIFDIKQATEKDTQIIVSLFKEYEKMLGFSLCFQKFDYEIEHLLEVYEQIWIAFSHQNPIGCIALKRLNEHNCEMKRLYVKAEYRKSGIGRKLVDTLLRTARQNYKILKLDTLASLIDAIKLYKSYGFVPTLPYNDAPLQDIQYYELDLRKDPSQSF